MNRSSRLLTAAVAAASVAGPLLVLPGARAATAKPLTENRAISLDKTAFAAMQRAVIVTPSDSDSRFPTGAALIAQVQKFAPSLRGIVNGSTTGTGGHVGLGKSTTKTFTAVSKLADGKTLTVTVNHEDLAHVHLS
jgi:predicted ATP-dependent serine protease